MSWKRKRTKTELPLHKDIAVRKIVDWLISYSKKQMMILVGLPASGKSSFAAHLAQAGATCLSRDQVRQELYGDESIHGVLRDVNRRYYRKMSEALQINNIVVSDGVHVARILRKDARQMARKFGHAITLIYFDVDLKTCLERNRKRSRVVNEEIMFDLHKQMQKSGLPLKSEGRLVVIRPGKKIDSCQVTNIREQ